MQALPKRLPLALKKLGRQAHFLAAFYPECHYYIHHLVFSFVSVTYTIVCLMPYSPWQNLNEPLVKEPIVNEWTTLEAHGILTWIHLRAVVFWGLAGVGFNVACNLSPLGRFSFSCQSREALYLQVVFAGLVSAAGIIRWQNFGNPTSISTKANSSSHSL